MMCEEDLSRSPRAGLPRRLLPSLGCIGAFFPLWAVSITQSSSLRSSMAFLALGWIACRSRVFAYRWDDQYTTTTWSSPFGGEVTLAGLLVGIGCVFGGLYDGRLDSMEGIVHRSRGVPDPTYANGTNDWDHVLLGSACTNRLGEVSSAIGGYLLSSPFGGNAFRIGS